MIERTHIIDTSRRLLDTPFEHNQRCPGVGIDCANVIAWVGEQIGSMQNVCLPPYDRQPDPKTFRAMLRKYMDPVEGYGLPGDVLTFSFIVQRHLAIVTGINPLRILHAYEPYGKVVEGDADDLWIKRSRSWWRYRGVGQWPA